MTMSMAGQSCVKHLPKAQKATAIPSYNLPTNIQAATPTEHLDQTTSILALSSIALIGKIVAPSNPADVKGLIAAAVRDPDPVIVFEHKSLYPEKGFVPHIKSCNLSFVPSGTSSGFSNCTTATDG